ncbi:MAG TPA: haloacid dehalogenase-like hydrolase [Thermoplasmata archaeon]|nr:haloacid dehalogenase-like hydrolase [Thermoplasmata archaeon]
MPSFPWRLVTFDIDGTLTLVHGWKYIADRRGLAEQWRRSTSRYLRKESTENEHLKELLGLGAGLSRRELYAFLSHIPKLRGIGAAVAALHERGARAALLTHNPPYVTDWWKRRYGFDDAAGIGNGPELRRGIVPEPGAIRADKIGGLRRLSKRWNAPRSTIVHVGDGWADAELFHCVGGSVALNSTLPEVRAAADVALRLRDLRPLVPELGRMHPHRAER